MYYSRTGTTRRAAQEIARALEADLEEIEDHARRGGLVGYLRSGLEAALGVGVEVDRPVHKPSDYDLVVLGCPTWVGSLPSPVRSFLWQHRDGLKSVAFFATCGGRGADRVIDQMAAASRREPVARLELRERTVRGGEAADAIRIFVSRIRQAVGEERGGDGARAWDLRQPVVRPS
jgi:flavodoxin